MAIRNSRVVLILNLAFVLLGLAVLNADLFLIRATSGLTPDEKLIQELKVFRDGDEAWYGVIMDHLRTEDCATVPVTYLYQDRPNFHSCTMMNLIVDAFPQVETSVLAWWMKLLLRIGVVFLVAGLVGMVGVPIWFGIGLGFLVGVDEGVFVFKPLYTTVRSLMSGKIDDFTRMYRLISPSLYWLPMIASLICWVRLWQPWRKVSQGFYWWLLACLFGFLFMAIVPFYAWLPWFWSVGAIVLISLSLRTEFSFDKADFAKLGVLLIGCVVFGIYNMGKVGIEGIDVILARSGFFKNQFQPLYVLDKGLIFACLALFASLYLWFKSNLPLTRLRLFSIVLISLGPYVLMNMNVLIGIDYQNFHYKDYLGPMMIAGIFVLVRELVTQKGRLLLQAFILVSISLALVQHVKSQWSPVERTHNIPFGYDFPGLPIVYNYFKKELSADLPENSVKASCGEYYVSLPLVTPLVCSYHHLLMTYPLTGPELMDVSMAHFKLLGWSYERLHEHIKVAIKPDRGQAFWLNGYKDEWFQTDSTNEVIDLGFLTNIAVPNWMELYTKFQVADALRVLEYPSYVITGLLPDESALLAIYKEDLIFRNNYGEVQKVWKKL